MWANDNPDDDAGLRYRDPNPANNAGHAVIPYRLERSTTNPVQFRLYVCNSNNPDSLNDFILIDSLANTWQEFTGFGWMQERQAHRSYTFTRLRSVSSRRRPFPIVLLHPGISRRRARGREA